MSSPGLSLDNLDPQTLQKLAMLLKQQTPFGQAGGAGNKLLQAYLLSQGQPQAMGQGMQMAPKMFGFG